MTIAIPDDPNFNLSPEQIQLLKNTVCKGATDDEFKLFIHTCTRTGLDPLRNQIYAIKRKEKMTIQTGIDGFRLIAERTGKYSPGKETTYGYDQQGKLVSATAYVKKQTQDGTWHEVSATAFWNEYVVSYNGKPSQFWDKMPHTMLSKVAESICLRKSFPANYSGIYSTEEMGQADNGQEINITPEAQPQTQAEQPKQIEQDLSPKEIDDWLERNWNQEKDSFTKWMKLVMNDTKWNHRKCIEEFEKDAKYCSDTFQSWLQAQSKL